MDYFKNEYSEVYKILMPILTLILYIVFSHAHIYISIYTNKPTHTCTLFVLHICECIYVCISCLHLLLLTSDVSELNNTWAWYNEIEYFSPKCKVEWKEIGLLKHFADTAHGLMVIFFFLTMVFSNFLL